MVSFNVIPNGLREPSVLTEVDGSKAQQGPSIQTYVILVVGQMTSGTWTPLTQNLATSAEQVRLGAGEGSMLALMAEKLFDVNKVTKAVFLSQADDGGAVAATKTITVTGTATEAGTLFLYVNGVRITVAVASGDVQNDIAAAIDAAISAADNLPYTNGVGTNVVTLTARNSGAAANDLDVRTNYFAGETTPAGVTVVIADGVTGTTDPDISDVWPVIGDTWYNLLAVGYDPGQAATLNSLDTELDDRFGPLRAIDAHAILAKRETHANLITLGDSRNGEHVTILPVAGPNAPFEWAAQATGQIALRAQADPARPYRLMPLSTLLAPDDTELFTYQENNLLLGDGISTYVVDDGGVVRLSRIITTYQTNAASAPDTAFLQLETMLSLSYIRFDFRTAHELAFPSVKLVTDASRLAPGQAVISPAIGAAFAVNRARLWEELGIIENAEQFKKDLVVERPSADPTRLDYLLPPDLVNQLFITAARFEFRL